MLARLAKLASISRNIRKDVLEKKAVVGALATLAGKGAMWAASNPVKTLTGVAAVQGGKAKYRENMQQFKASSDVPLPPGVG